VLSMIKLYQLETIPSWNSNYTFFNFYNTALLGGILICLVNNTFKSDQVLSYTVLVLLVAQLLLFFPHLSSLGKIGYLPLISYCFVFIFSAINLFGTIPYKGKLTISLISILFYSFGILAERYIFYASYKSLGM
jgi:DMSO reductase anchor subunit